jgi:chromosome segregation ATPase
MSQNMTPIHARVDSLEADLVNRISVMIQDTFVKHVDSLKAQVTASEREAAASINNLVKNLESTKAELNLSASTISERLKILDDAILSTKTDVRACATSMDHAIKATQNDIAQLRDMISSKKDDQTEQVQPKAVLAWRSSPRRRRMRPS